MKKSEQIEMNANVLSIFNDAVSEYWHSRNCVTRRLRSCSAEVIETEHYFLLRSYNTLIACISKGNDTLYDALRHEYKYTATCAQHIAKFDHDYCAGYWGCADRETYRPV